MRRSPRQCYPYVPGDLDPFIRPLQGFGPQGGPAVHAAPPLPLQQHERDALKVGFFGREILDVLATPEGLRSERHENAASWFQRLAATGFSIQPVGVELGDSGHPSVQAEERGLRVALTGGGESLVSVFAAR